jgi:hypothetical protein
MRIGLPGPDFPGGIGESAHLGRADPEYLVETADKAGLKAMGLHMFEQIPDGNSRGQIRLVGKANTILGFR